MSCLLSREEMNGRRKRLRKGCNFFPGKKTLFLSPEIFDPGRKCEIVTNNSCEVPKSRNFLLGNEFKTFVSHPIFTKLQLSTSQNIDHFLYYS